MSKRTASEANFHEEPRKRRRCVPHSDRISGLSDELLLRILGNLEVKDLTICQGTSHRFNTLAGDQQIWKAAYYKRFVRPRVDRIQRIQKRSSRMKPRSRAPDIKSWLDEERLIEKGNGTNWKNQYKLRHKWQRGACHMSEIPVEPRPSIPPFLARLHQGIVYTADHDCGLRAWSYKDKKTLLGETQLSTAEEGSHSLPTALCVDSQERPCDFQRIAVGYEDGSFGIYSYDKVRCKFRQNSVHPPSSSGRLCALAFASPYIVTMNGYKTLSVYQISHDLNDEGNDKSEPPLHLLTSLKSGTAWPPLSLSIRKKGTHLLVTIAYCMQTLRSVWTTGVQEIKLSFEGEILDSRLASAVDSGFSSLATLGDLAAHHRAIASGESTFSQPTSLSYSHPYLLTSYSDNTMTLYLINSQPNFLSVRLEKRLWGHTSSVFAAQIGDNGKAVSVTTEGNDLRIWDLEECKYPRRTQAYPGVHYDKSVRLSPNEKASTTSDLESISRAIHRRGTGLGCAVDNRIVSKDITRAWVGFDEENIVVLREHEQGRQAFAVYDFS